MVSTSICKPTYGLGLSLDAMVCFNVTDTDHFSQQSSPPSNLRSHSTARFTTILPHHHHHHHQSCVMTHCYCQYSSVCHSTLPRCSLQTSQHQPVLLVHCSCSVRRYYTLSARATRLSCVLLSCCAELVQDCVLPPALPLLLLQYRRQTA